MPDVVSPEKLHPRRFAGKRTPEDPFAPYSRPFAYCRSEGTFPGHPAARRAFAAAPVTVMVRSSIPLGGMESKTLCRLPGALRVLAAARPLSTGVLRKAARMIYISYVRVGR